MPTQEQRECPAENPARPRSQIAPSVQLDLGGFLTELREWIEAVEAGKWDVASERLRDACDEAYCLEGWKEFTNRLGTSNMQHHVHNLRRFLVAVETTARSVCERELDDTTRE
jgi:hypothetical protein